MTERQKNPGKKLSGNHEKTHLVLICSFILLYYSFIFLIHIMWFCSPQHFTIQVALVKQFVNATLN